MIESTELADNLPILEEHYIEGLSYQEPSLLKINYLIDRISCKEFVFTSALIELQGHVIKLSPLNKHATRRSLVLSKLIFVLELMSSGLVPTYPVDEQELR